VVRCRVRPPRGGEARDGVAMGDRKGIHRSDCGSAPSIDDRDEGPREGVRYRDLGEPGRRVRSGPRTPFGRQERVA